MKRKEKGKKTGYPYFVSRVNKDPYDRKKCPQKKRKKFQQFLRGRGGRFICGQNIYPLFTWSESMTSKSSCSLLRPSMVSPLSLSCSLRLRRELFCSSIWLETATTFVSRCSLRSDINCKKESCTQQKFRDFLAYLTAPKRRYMIY